MIVNRDLEFAVLESGPELDLVVAVVVLLELDLHLFGTGVFDLHLPPRVRHCTRESHRLSTDRNPDRSTVGVVGFG